MSVDGQFLAHSTAVLMSISLRPNLSRSARVVPAATDRPQQKELKFAASLLTVLFGMALALTIGGLLGLWLYGFTHSSRIYEGVSVGDVSVGGMTRAEARATVADRYQNFSETPILLRADGQLFSFDPAEIGITLNVGKSVEAAYRIGRDGSFWERSGTWAGAIVDGRDVTIVIDVDDERIDKALASLAPDVTRAPKDAQLAFNETGEPSISPELPGVSLDVAATRQRIVERVRSLSTEPIDIVTPIVAASVTVEDLEPGLERARATLQSPLIVGGLDSFWGISAADIQRIVSIVPGSETIEVKRDAVATFVQSIADEVNRSPENANLDVGDDGRLTAQLATTGISVNVDGTTDAIIHALQGGYQRVDLLYQQVDPTISSEAAELAAANGEAMLDRGVEITWEGGSTELDRATLLSALTIQVRPDEPEPFVFGFDREIVAESLQPTFSSIGSSVLEPRLRLVDDKVTIAQTGRAGEVIDVEASLDAVVKGALDDSGTAELVIEHVEPTLSMPVIADIKLDDVLAEASTYYGDSSDARRKNVEKAVELETGWLVAPGAQFSYVENIGDITEANGFVTGFGIVEDPNSNGVTTAPVIGGGICQVSTTIFQAAFWAGLKIDERYSHPYWIQSYGEPPRGMKGLDAMVNIEDYGSLDLRFTNNTENWIAVVVIADGVTVTARVLGTDPGWTVDIKQPVITNIIKPGRETVFTDSPELPKGQQLQVEYAQDGFSTEIARTVTAKDGEVISSGSLVSTYAPSRNTILRGTGPEAN
jgi:vancomycin resistance protein YoaR